MLGVRFSLPDHEESPWIGLLGLLENAVFFCHMQLNQWNHLRQCQITLIITADDPLRLKFFCSGKIDWFTGKFKLKGFIP